jgi:catechol 2,3-dioxygenase-like lactoylglutathione lyase family enzyme
VSAPDPAITIPVLASLDLDETQRFYRDQLGFSVTAFGDYAIARRDRMEIHFWLASDRIHPEHTSCYIRGGQIVALYEEYRAKGVPRLSDFQVRPWNMKEFYIHDPHGNLLRFGGAPEELDPH